MTENESSRGAGFECVAPEWSRRLARLDEPDLAADERRALEDHLFICDACRLQRAAEQAVVEHLASGGTAGARAASSRRAGRRLPAFSAVALAASLVAILLWPPAAPERGPRRDLPASGFLRPVEGEVVRSATPVLSWNPIPGATAYEIEISEVEGDYSWTARTEVARVRVPADRALPPKARLRGMVRPIPADLAGPVDVSVAFRRAGWAAYATYRLRTAPFVLYLVLVGALVGLFWEWPLRRRRAAR